MRTAGLASILLLASGSVLGFPQYPSQNQDSTDDSAAGGGSVSGEFWWQQGGAFGGNGGGSDATEALSNIFNQVVSAFNSSVSQVTPQVTSQVTSGNSVTPTQSEYCALGQGCVPWQLCPLGVITQGSNVEPGKVPYPAGAGYTGCSDVSGNVCCGIPVDVLTQQQQEQNPAVPHSNGGSDSSNLNAQCASNQDCVPYFQCYNGEINVDGAGLLDVRTKPKATCSHPEYPDVPAICCRDPSKPEPIISATPTPYPIINTTPESQCDGCKVCVSQGICDATGNIITDGGGLLDLRIVHKRCNVDGTSEVGVCCKPPGCSTATPRPIPNIDVCPSQSICIEPSLCRGEAMDSTSSWTSYSPTGTIFSQCTVGSGSYSGPGVCCINPIPIVEICPRDSPCIDPSLCKGEALDGTSSWIDYSSTGKIFSQCTVGSGSYNGPGVCCINPIPIVEICPRNSPCIDPSLCKGEALDSTSSWIDYSSSGKIFSQCTVGSGSYSGPGVCCINPIPIVEICPRDSPCIDPSLCKGEALDSTSSWIDYASTGNIFSQCTVGSGSYSGPGVCCINPTPALETCPNYDECVPQNQCDQNGNIITDGSGSIDIRRKTTACYVDDAKYETGVCCKPPSLPVIKVDTCPGTSSCVPELLCSGQALSNGGSMVNYVAGGLWSTCNLAGDYNTPGICCEVPAPVKVIKPCSGSRVCVDQSQCGQDGSVVTDGSGIFDLRTKSQACYTDEAAYTEGVCCNPPALPIVNTCPGVSTCVPDFLCTGQVLDSTSNMIAYIPQGSFSQCPIGVNSGVMGICCINPPPPSTSRPIDPPSNQCGRRNKEEVLDTRIQSVIANNEAQFGEFPWQAIIFFTNYTFKCGASLIGDRWLVTGGHCVSGLKPSEIQIRLGEWQVNSFDEPLAYVDVQVKAITVHPDFNIKNVQNNVAVLELIEPVDIQYHINSICLPAPGQTFPNQRCIISGWGKESFEGNYQHIIKKVDVPTVDKKTCQALLSKTRLGKWFILHNSFMCAGGEENKDACKGDGGGPLACEDPSTGRYYLAGLTSWGIGCGNKDVPGVYADVQGFSTWIQGVIGGTLVQQQQVVGPEVETGSNPYGK